MKQNSENVKLFHVMLNVGSEGNIDAFEDALRIIKEIEQDGMSVVRNANATGVPCPGRHGQ